MSLWNDCIRSCLIECQSFFDSKINIDQKCSVLMVAQLSLMSVIDWSVELDGRDRGRHLGRLVIARLVLILSLPFDFHSEEVTREHLFSTDATLVCPINGVGGCGQCACTVPPTPVSNSFSTWSAEHQPKKPRMLQASFAQLNKV